MNKLVSKAKGFLTKEGSAANGIFILAIAVIFAVNILLFVITEAFGLYIYQRERDDLSLSGNTDELFAEAIVKKEKVKISFCMPKEDIEKHSTGNYVHTTAKNFAEKYPDFIELEYINIMTRRNSKGELVDVDKYKTDMRGESTVVLKTSVIFECDSNYRVLTDASTTQGFASFFTIDASQNTTSYNGEEVMASMISWVLKSEHKTVYFTERHGELADIALSNLLVCAGYYIDTVDLRNRDVPADAAMVFISNPRTDFEKAADGSGVITEIERLKIYLAKGGNLFVTLDPYVKTLHTFEAFLKEYGIAFSSGETSSGHTVRNIVKDSSGAITTDGFTLVAKFANSPLADKISQKIESLDGGDVIIKDVSALELSGNAKPLFTASSSAVTQAGGITTNTDGDYVIAAYSELPTDAGSSKIFVVPSIYLAVSDSLVSREYSNKDFTYALFEEFFESDKPPYGCRAVVYDKTTLQNLTMGKARVYTAIILAVPAVLAGVGIFVTVKRKNR